MSPSPDFPGVSSPPYTQTSMQSSDMAALSSIMASFNSKGGGPTNSALLSSVSSSLSAASVAATAQSSPATIASTTIASTTSVPSTFVTSSTPLITSSTTPGSNADAATDSPTTSSSASSVTGSSAASSSDTSTFSRQQECSGISCDSGLQAAVAVPVVIVAAIAIGLLFFCMRRRKRRRQTVEGGAVEKPKASGPKKWSRHLRIFSFDTELLMGGRFSSTNSVRSRQTGSLRSGPGSMHSGRRSLQSVEEVAPPYRDAISHTQPLNMTTIRPGASDPLARPVSAATAPPPYGAGAMAATAATAAGAAAGTGAVAVGRPNTGSSASATTPTSRRNPFADNPPVSPVEDSPFNDPLDDEGSIMSTPTVSRHSSVLQGARSDAASAYDASEAGSIREAQIVRNSSVMSSGRIIENVRRTS